MAYLKSYSGFILFLLLAYLELALINHPVDAYYNPIFLVSTGLALSALYYFFPAFHAPFRWSKRLRYFILLLVIVGVIATFKIWSQHFLLESVSAHDASRSDVIPSIIQIVQKFLHHQEPYTILYFKKHALPTTYLPMMWLPYVFCEWFHFDYRQLAIAALWGAILLTLIGFTNSKKYAFPNPAIALVALLWLPFSYYTYVNNDMGIITFAVESLPAAFYLLFAWSWSVKSYHWMGLLLGFCLLSRFSILLFVPLLGWVLLWQDRKTLWTIMTMAGATLLLLYLLPFLLPNPNSLMKGYAYYTQAAIGEWTVAVKEHGYWHMGNGLGFTKWMITSHPHSPIEDLVAKYQSMHKWALCLMITATSVFFLIFRKKINLHRFVLANLKVYLVVFYALVQVPYRYLFIVPLVVTSVLWMDLFRKPSHPVINFQSP